MPGMPSTVESPDVKDATSKDILDPWNVILLNDDHHTFDEVITQLIKATRCTSRAAGEIAMEVHTTGEAVCYSGPFERCELVASILEEIGLGTKLEKA